MTFNGPPVPGLTLQHVLRGHTDWIGRIAWSPGGSYLASGGGDKRIIVWGTLDESPHHILTGHSEGVSCVAWAIGRLALASGSADKTVRVWDIENETAQIVFTGHSGFVRALSWVGDTPLIASGSEDGTLRIWDSSTGSSIRTIREHDWILAIAASPAGEWIAVGYGSGTIKLFATADWKVRATLNGHKLWVDSIAWHPSRDLLASASGDKTIGIWEPARQKPVQIIEGHSKQVRSVTFSSDGTLLASKADDGLVTIWNTEDWKQLYNFSDAIGHEYWPPAIAFKPQHPVLATFGEENTTLRIWTVDADALRGNTPTITILQSVREQWERHPDDPQLTRQLVELLRARGQIDEAAHVFDSLIDAHPDDAELVRQKASLYLEVGDQRRYYETLQAAEEISAADTFRDNVGKPITLTGVEIRDLPFFGNFTWELQPNVNVLLGRNGYGKSHLLRAVVGMLQNDRTVTGQFFAPRSGRGARPLMRVDVTKENAALSIERSRLVFEKQFGAVPLLAIPDMRYIEKADDAFAPVAGALDLARQGATHFLQERSFQGLILTFIYELCREFDRHQGFDRPIFRLMQDVVQGLTDRSFTFLDVVELDNAGFRILVATDGNESNPLPLQKASQGTLSVLSMVGLVYRFLKAVHPSVAEDALTKQPGIVVIDEIDAHLHPLWQQQILQLFRDTFPNVQFIVTAHTPLVVAGCKKREVAVLQKGTGGFTVQVRDEHFIGATAESLYRRVFDVDDKDVAYLRLNSLQARAPEFRKRVEELQDRPTLSAAESAELDDLEEKLFYLDEAEHIASERAQAATFTRDRQRIEMELRNQEGKVAELQNQVSALKQELDTSQGPSTEKTPPS